MGCENSYPFKIPSKQLNKSFSTLKTENIKLNP